MKATVMQYVSLTVMVILIVAVVSFFPERKSADNSSVEANKTAANSISERQSAQN